MGTIIRRAEPSDALAISEIYNRYILNTAVTFEAEAIDESEMRCRIVASAGSGRAEIRTLYRRRPLAASNIVGERRANASLSDPRYSWSEGIGGTLRHFFQIIKDESELGAYS